MELEHILKHYPTQFDCIQLLERLVWNSKPKCHNCGSNSLSDIEFYKLHSKNAYTCGDCNSIYTVTQKTLFHHTHLPLVKWFTLIHVIKTSKRLPSSYRLADMIVVGKTTALRLRRMILSDLKTENSLCERIYQHNRQYESDW